MKQYFLFLFVSFTTLVSFSQTLTVEEMKLYNFMMEYRKKYGLPPVPISPSLTFVAQTHSKDLEENNPNQEGCNMHSWSSTGSWQGCCYTDDHAAAKCMWDKPRELTSYLGDGFEIAFWCSAFANANEALESWKSSSGHNEVIINSGIWSDHSWQAIGIGIYGGYAVVWFGNVLEE